MRLRVDLTADMLDTADCRTYWRGKFHPEGAICPVKDCRTSLSGLEAEKWKDGAEVKCPSCGRTYTWRTGTPLANKGIDPRQLLLLCALSLYERPQTEIAAACRLSTRTVRRYQLEMRLRP